MKLPMREMRKPCAPSAPAMEKVYWPFRLAFVNPPTGGGGGGFEPLLQALAKVASTTDAMRIRRFTSHPPRGRSTALLTGAGGSIRTGDRGRCGERPVDCLLSGFARGIAFPALS